MAAPPWPAVFSEKSPGRAGGKDWKYPTVASKHRVPDDSPPAPREPRPARRRLAGRPSGPAAAGRMMSAGSGPDPDRAAGRGRTQRTRCDSVAVPSCHRSYCCPGGDQPGGRTVHAGGRMCLGGLSAAPVSGRLDPESSRIGPWTPPRKGRAMKPLRFRLRTFMVLIAAPAVLMSVAARSTLLRHVRVDVWGGGASVHFEISRMIMATMENGCGSITFTRTGATIPPVNLAALAGIAIGVLTLALHYRCHRRKRAEIAGSATRRSLS